MSAFLLLLIEYVARTSLDHDVKDAIARKDKRKLPLPVGPLIFISGSQIYLSLCVVLLLAVQTDKGAIERLQFIIRL